MPPDSQCALVFTNTSAPSDPSVETIRCACRRFGIERIDVTGLTAGNPVAAPEKLLGGYDLVFAKARCALEAMATGCAVIVADIAGLGGYVSTDNVADMRRLNFGVRTMQQATVTEETILRELDRYDAMDAEQVSNYIRAQADMETAVDRWLSVYERTLAGHKDSGKREDMCADRLSAASDYLRTLSPMLKSHKGAELRARQAKDELACSMNRLLEHRKAHNAAELRTRQAKDELACSMNRLLEHQSELRTIHESPGWKSVMLYRRLRRWILRL